VTTTVESALTVADLRALARARIPRAVFDYADGGAYSESTLRANETDFKRLRLRQRVLIDVEARSTCVEVAGQRWALPVGIAPTGLAGLFHGDGEIHGARAAAAAGVPYCLSTMSILSLEQTAAAVSQPFWFQLYVMRDRGFTAELIERARAARCSALVVTADLQVQGQRHRDVRSGLTVPPRITAATLVDLLSRPRWALGVLCAKRRDFGNLAGLRGASGIQTLAAWIASQFDPTFTWHDLAWIRERWPRRLILKGILDADDARQAAALGVETIVVSNHGGRQLDGAPSSIAALPAIHAAVGDRIELLFDGGVQSGQDVFKALALGARACLVGKAYLFALAAGGERGVVRMLDIIGRELSTTMALTGVRTVEEISTNHLYPPDRDR
jgi:L-lactate dehydrogenase (cytochrome)